MRTLAILLSLLIIAATGSSHTISVCPGGTKTIPCGAWDEPCANLNLGIQQATNATSPSIVLLLCSNSTHILESDTNLAISGALELTIRGYPGRARLDLNDSNGLLLRDANPPLNITLSNLFVTRGNNRRSIDDYGGCLSVNSPGSIVEISRCVFHECRSTSPGGAVGIVNTVVSNITNTVFTHNIADNCEFGGAIYIKHDSTKQRHTHVSGCTFHANSVRRTGGFSTHGGAIAVQKGTLSVEYSTFTFNNASSITSDTVVGSYGGAVHVSYEHDADLLNPAPVTFAHTTFDHNRAVAHVHDAEVATAYGGAISVSLSSEDDNLVGASVSIRNCTFTHNDAPAVSRDDGWRGKTATSSGGAVHLLMKAGTNSDGNTISVTDSLFDYNEAACTTYMSDSSGNHKCAKTVDERVGGALAIVLNGDTRNLKNSVLIADSNFTRNTATSCLMLSGSIGSSDAENAKASGGAISILIKGDDHMENTIDIDGCRVVGNLASALGTVTVDGGGGGVNILVQGDSVRSNTFRVANSIISGNHVYDRGGSSTTATAQIAGFGGGGVAIQIRSDDPVERNSVVMDSISFVNNMADISSGRASCVLRGGGALVAMTGDPIALNNVTFASCHHLGDKVYATSSLKADAEGGSLAVVIQSEQGDVNGNMILVDRDRVNIAQAYATVGKLGSVARATGGGVSVLWVAPKGVINGNTATVTRSRHELTRAIAWSVDGQAIARGGAVAHIVEMAGEDAKNNEFTVSDTELHDTLASTNSKHEQTAQYGVADGGAVYAHISSSKYCDGNLVAMTRVLASRGRAEVRMSVGGEARGGSLSSSLSCTDGHRSALTPSRVVLEASSLADSISMCMGQKTSAAYGGGVVAWATGAAMHVTLIGGTKISHNRVVSTSEAAACTGGGGGVFLSFFADKTSIVTLNSSVISGNVVSDSDASIGGGVWIMMAESATRTEIHDSRIDGNRARRAGGMAWHDRSAIAKAMLRVSSGVRFEGNTAGNEGTGGLLLSHESEHMVARTTPILIRGAVFKSNSAAGTCGGLTFVNVAAKLDNVSFIDNSAGSFGGGLVARSMSNITMSGGTKFDGNTASRGMHMVLETASAATARDTSFFVPVESEFVLFDRSGLMARDPSIVVTCPVGAPFTVSALSWACTMCPMNHYAVVASRDTCETCEGVGGMTCAGGANVTALHGFQTIMNGSGVVQALLCLPGWCCGQSDGCGWNTSCAAGRSPSVPFCGACKVGHSEAFGTVACISSSKCGSSGAWVALSILIVLMVVYCIRQILMTPAPKIGGLKSAMYFFQSTQLVTVASSASSVAMTISQLFSFNLNGLGLLGADNIGVCLADSMSASTKMIMSGFVLPLLVLLILGMIFVVLLLIRLIRKRKLDAEVWRARLGMAATSIVLSVYTNVARATFSLVHCGFDGAGSMVMYSAGDTKCYGQWFQILSFIVLIPVVCAFPILIVLFAGRMRKRADDGETDGASALRLLIAAYRPRYWYWEGVMMGRRVILVAMVTFIAEPVTRSFLLLVVCFGFLGIHVLLSPFATAETGRLETVVLSFLTLLAGFGIRDADRIETGLPLGGVAVDVIIYTMYGMVFVQLFQIFARNWVARFRSWRGGKKESGESQGESVEL